MSAAGSLPPLAAEFAEFARLVDLADGMRPFDTIGSAASAVGAATVAVRAALAWLGDHPDYLQVVAAQLRDNLAHLRWRVASASCVEAGAYVTSYPGGSS